MAAPTWQTPGSSFGTTSTSFSPTMPTHTSGDWLYICTESGGAATPALTTANGWALLDTVAAGTSTRNTIFYIKATSASMSAPVMDTNGADHMGGRIMVIRGADATTPIDVYATNSKTSASTTATFPSVTTSGADRLIICIGTRDNDSASTAAWSSPTNANLTGLGEESESGTLQGNGGGMCWISGVKSTAGATGTTTASVVSSENANFTIAFQDTAGGPPPVAFVSKIVWI